MQFLFPLYYNVSIQHNDIIIRTVQNQEFAGFLLSCAKYRANKSNIARTNTDLCQISRGQVAVNNFLMPNISRTNTDLCQISREQVVVEYLSVYK